LRGSGHYPQSPEQGEWMSFLQTFPITNRLPRHQSIFCVVLTLGNMVEPGFMPLLLVLSWFLPPCDVAAHRGPPSPTGDGASRPAFVLPPPPLASWHSFPRVHTIAARIVVSCCPVGRLPACIATSPPATVVRSGLLPCWLLAGVDCPLDFL